MGCSSRAVANVRGVRSLNLGASSNRVIDAPSAAAATVASNFFDNLSSRFMGLSNRQTQAARVQPSEGTLHELPSRAPACLVVSREVNSDRNLGAVLEA